MVPGATVSSQKEVTWFAAKAVVAVLSGFTQNAYRCPSHHMANGYALHVMLVPKKAENENASDMQLLVLLYCL